MVVKNHLSQVKKNWLKKLTFASLLLIGISCSQDELVVTDSDIEPNITAAKSDNSVELSYSSITASAEQSTNPIGNINDNGSDYMSTRWAGNGTSTSVFVDFGTEVTVDYLKIAFNRGDERKASFSYWQSDNGTNWTWKGKKNSAGETESHEEFDLNNITARYLRIKFQGSTYNDGNSTTTWNSVYDIEIYGTPGEDTVTSTTDTVEWQNWYLSVPINDGDGATSIYYEDIEAMNLSSEEQEYFTKNSDGSYKMYTKFTGYTTSGEKDLDSGSYCRTELREYYRGNQSTSDNWSMNSGTHIMESTLAVENCGGDGRTYVGQIHGYKTGTLTKSPATVKVQWNNGDIRLEYYTAAGIDDDGEWTSTNDEAVTIATVDNEKFILKIKIEDGKLYVSVTCSAKGINTGYTEYYDYDANGYIYDNYFKTGNYFKWNDDYSESAEVTLYGVTTSHN